MTKAMTMSVPKDAKDDLAPTAETDTQLRLIIDSIPVLAWCNLPHLFGLLYFPARLTALFLFFLPRSGAAHFGLQEGGPTFALYLLVVNLPFGIVTALMVRAIGGGAAVAPVLTREEWSLR